jgi:hypothetical protein
MLAAQENINLMYHDNYLLMDMDSHGLVSREVERGAYTFQLVPARIKFDSSHTTASHTTA